jgi:signal transduction histidine kinase
MLPERIRQSLALRLAAQYALVFACGAGLLFGALYWYLAEALEQREQGAVEARAEILGRAYEVGGVAALRTELAREIAPEVRSVFVRILGPGGETLFASVPSDWIETQVQRLPLPEGWGSGEVLREIRTVRVPQSAARDYAIASRGLFDGSLLQVGRSTDSRAVLLAPVRRAFAGIGTIALGVALVAGTLLAWRATRPLRAVSETARRILETGDLAARVPGAGRSGELAVLVAQLNTLLEKNATHVRVLRETLDNLAHDLRTPLTRLRGTAELALQDSGDPAQAREALLECINESDRVRHLLETLLDVSAAEAGALALNREAIDVRTLVERAQDLYREVAEERTITVSVALPPEPIAAELDAVRFGQVVNNLVDNALKYTPTGGRVALDVRRDAAAVVLTVSDTGPGIPPAERDAVFRRLYRRDASRSQRGLGLGLSLVKAIVEAHGGSVRVDDAPGGGACFEVRIPVEAGVRR